MKIHAATDMEPLRKGDIRAVCGEVVKKAEFVFVLDGDIRGVRDMRELCNCRKCIKSKIEGRYVAGIVAGEELKSEDAE